MSSNRSDRFNSDQERLKHVYRPRTGAGEFWDHRSWSMLDPSLHFQESQFRDHVMQYLRENFQNFDALSKMKVLEVGAGWGRNLYMFHELGLTHDQVKGVELLPHFVDRAHEVMPSLSVAQGDAQKLPFQNGEFDLIVCHTVLSAILDENIRNGILGECHRILKSKGSILICDIRDCYPTSKNANVVFIAPPGLKKLRASLSAKGFQVEKVRSLGLMPRLRRAMFDGFWHSLLKKFGINACKAREFSCRRPWAEMLSSCPLFGSHFFLSARKI